MEEKRINLSEFQKASTERLLTGYPAPRKRLSPDQNPLEQHSRELALPVTKITEPEKEKRKNKVVGNLAENIPQEQSPPFQPKPEPKRKFNTHNQKQILFGMDKVFDTINTVDHELLIAYQKLRLQKALLELKNVNYENMMKKGNKDIEDLGEEIKLEKRKFKEKKLQLQQKYDDDIKESTDKHHQLVSFIETQIERQVRWRKFQWLPDTDAFSGQIEAFHDLLKYSRGKYESEKSVKLKTLGKVLAASERTLESYKINLAAMDSEFKKQVAELTNRINAIHGKSESLQLKNEEAERRLKAFQEQRIKEENELCDHFNYLFKEFVETQQERLLIAKQKRDLMKQMAQESTDQVNEAKKKVKKLRDAIIPPDITKPDIDELAAKARLRVGKIILKQLQEENNQLKEDLRISSSISSLTTPSLESTSTMMSSSGYSSSYEIARQKPKPKPIIRKTTRSSSGSKQSSLLSSSFGKSDSGNSSDY